MTKPETQRGVGWIELCDKGKAIVGYGQMEELIRVIEDKDYRRRKEKENVVEGLQTISQQRRDTKLADQVEGKRINEGAVLKKPGNRMNVENKEGKGPKVE